jgi:hypothetical protein
MSFVRESRLQSGRVAGALESRLPALTAALLGAPLLWARKEAVRKSLFDFWMPGMACGAHGAPYILMRNRSFRHQGDSTYRRIMVSCSILCSMDETKRPLRMPGPGVEQAWCSAMVAGGNPRFIW